MVYSQQMGTKRALTTKGPQRCRGFKYKDLFSRKVSKDCKVWVVGRNSFIVLKGAYYSFVGGAVDFPADKAAVHIAKMRPPVIMRGAEILPIKSCDRLWTDKQLTQW